MGLPKDDDVEPLRGLSYPFGGFFISHFKIALFSSCFPSDLKSVFGETKMANAQLHSCPVIANPNFKPSGGSHEKDFPEGVHKKSLEGFEQ